jgi:DNA-binding Lrp family transcriptional regulator
VPRPSGDLGGGQVQRAGEMSLPPARPATGVDEHEAGIARGERGVDIGDVGLEREAWNLLATTPEVGEAHHVTGEDCFVLTVRARSMRHLEQVTGRISGLGAVTTSVVYSSPLPRRAVVASATGASAAAASASRRRA